MTIIIKDLLLDKELDQDVMASVRGGFYFGGGTSSTSQSQTQPGSSPSTSTGFGGDPLQVNNSPDQHQTPAWSFVTGSTDLVTKYI